MGLCYYMSFLTISSKRKGSESFRDFSCEHALEELPIIQDIPSELGSAAGDLKQQCINIRNIFRNSQEELSRDQRHQCFFHINMLRSILSICPNAEYMHREVYLRQAEHVRDKKSHVEDPISLASLDGLAKRYIQSFSAFREIILKPFIEFYSIQKSLTTLSMAHFYFSNKFAPISQRARMNKS